MVTTPETTSFGSSTITVSDGSIGEHGLSAGTAARGFGITLLSIAFIVVLVYLGVEMVNTVMRDMTRLGSAFSG